MAASEGFVALPRDILGSEVWQSPALLKVWAWCHLRANWRPQQWYGETIEIGQFVTGTTTGSDETGLPKTTFWRLMRKLENLGRIGMKVERRFSVVTVLDYMPYGEPGTTDGTKVEPKWNVNGTKVGTIEQITNNKKQEQVITLGQLSLISDQEEDLPDVPTGLQGWVDWWNGLHAEGLVNAAIRSGSPNQGVVKRWKAAQKNPVLRALLAQRPQIEQAIRGSEFVRGKWFCLEKLFGAANKDGALIVEKLLEGGYADKRPAVASSVTPPPAGAIMRGSQLRWLPPEFERNRDACIHAIERWADYQWRNHRRCWLSIEDAEVWMVDQALKSHHQFVHDVTKSMAKGWKSVIEDETFIGPPAWHHGAEDRANIDMESGRRLRPFLGKNYPAHLGNGATTNVTTAATAAG